MLPREWARVSWKLLDDMYDAGQQSEPPRYMGAVSDEQASLMHLIHLALQSHGAVFDPLFLRHLIVEHALQFLKSSRARL